jgi:hypothetical protein
MVLWEKMLEQRGTILTALQGGGPSFAETPFVHSAAVPLAPLKH